MLLPVSKVYINSEDRLSGSSEDFSYSFINKDIKYDMCSIAYASISKTYYNVRQGYNYFILSEGEGIDNQSVVTIPPGTYSRSNFATSLRTLLSVASPNKFVYNILPSNSLQAETGKFTYQVFGNPSTPPSFIFPITSLIFEQMGFIKGSVNTFGTNKILVSTIVTNFASETCLFLRSDMCYDSHTNDNILQEIYTNRVPYFGNIIFENKIPNEYGKRIVKQGSVFKFYLTDQYGNVLNLNRANLHFTLLLWRVDHFKHVVESYI